MDDECEYRQFAWLIHQLVKRLFMPPVAHSLPAVHNEGGNVNRETHGLQPARPSRACRVDRCVS
jgi:hypothetical protein